MRLSLGYQVLIAVILGILCGLFFGPMAAIFTPIASIFVMLLQMITMPYIVLSIIHGLATLNPAAAKHLCKKSLPFWVLLWAAMFLIVFLISALIPHPLSTGISFQEPSPALKTDIAKNILTLLVPENPIGDLVNNILPAVAVFGIVVGIAFIFIEKKEPLIDVIERSNEIIEKIFSWLVRIAPIGVFAHVAVIAGTLDGSDLHRYALYLAVFAIISIFVIFWLLPSILSSCTPLTFRESIQAINDVCLITFFTGITMIAIPLIHSYLRQMVPKHNLHFTSEKEILVPFSYSFGQIGNSLFLFFIAFVSFYFRHPFSGSEYALLSLLAIPLSIGASSLSLNSASFLFKEMNFYENAQEVFSATAPVTINFQASLSMAGALTLILLALFAHHRSLQIKWKPLFFKVIGSLILLTGIVFSVRSSIHLEDNYSNFYMNRKISEALTHPVQPQIYLPGDTLPSAPATTEDALERVLRTGILRVGYDTQSSIPYVYYNSLNELVGFDIAMAYQLARDLNCSLELVPLDYDHLGEELNEGRYDIAMSAILMTESRIQQMSFSNAYSDQNFSLIVPVRNKDKFSTLAEINSQKGLVIGGSGGYKRPLVHFPNAIKTEGHYWESDLEEGRADAWSSAHIISIVWCLNHPRFVVYEYGGQLGKCYFAYPVQLNSLKFLDFINNWIQLKQQDKFYEQQYNYWIMGKSPMIVKKERWSIIHNLLHWID